MPTIPNEFYAIERDGFSRISISKEFIGPHTEILVGMAKFVPRIVRNLIPRTSLMVNQTGFALARALDSIALHTYYRPMVDIHEKAVMVPVWTPPGSEINCTWKPPGDMVLFFIARWEAKDCAPPIGMEPLCYLVARHIETRRTYLLPLPNLYEDARICLGRVRFSNDLINALEIFEKGISVLQTTTWNTDLLRKTERETHALFRFDENGTQVPIDGDWTKSCVPVNNGNYEFIAKI